MGSLLIGTGGGYPVSNFTSKKVAFARRVCCGREGIWRRTARGWHKSDEWKLKNVWNLLQTDVIILLMLQQCVCLVLIYQIYESFTTKVLSVWMQKMSGGCGSLPGDLRTLQRKVLLVYGLSSLLISESGLLGFDRDCCTMHLKGRPQTSRLKGLH